jgi:putative pyruvate formate lyase activating enzyme
VPTAPVNVMAQFHPDNFCDPAGAKYRDKYAEISRRPTHAELDHSWRRAHELGLKFETTTFERCSGFWHAGMLEIVTSGGRGALQREKPGNEPISGATCHVEAS